LFLSTEQALQVHCKREKLPNLSTVGISVQSDEKLEKIRGPAMRERKKSMNSNGKDEFEGAFFCGKRRYVNESAWVVGIHNGCKNSNNGEAITGST